MNVYILECTGDFDFRDAEYCADYAAIKAEAQKRQTVFTLQQFQDGVNDEEINLINSYILIDTCG